MHRREFLTLPPALMLAGGGLSLLPRRVAAQTGEVPEMFTAMIRRSLGDVTVTALGDGFLMMDHALTQGIDEETYRELIEAGHLDPGGIRGAVNAYLVERGEEKILIDAGTGPVMGPTLGQVSENLGAAGVSTEDIGTLLMTHLHPDHVGGAVDEAGATFPNAGFVLSETERAHWTDPATRDALPDEFKVFADLANAALDAYGERVVTHQGEAEVTPGITAVPLPGHTPGHVGYRIEGSEGSLLIWADVVHIPPVQFARPDVTLIFDADPDQAAETRARVFDMAASDGQMVAGMHLFFPGFGYVERAGDGYRFAAAPWDYG